MAFRRRRKASRMDRIVKFIAFVMVFFMVGGIIFSLVASLPTIREILNL